MNPPHKNSVKRVPIENGEAIQAEFDYPVSVEELWDLLTTKNGLTKWFPRHAHITPGKEGLFAVAWFDRFSWVDRIVEWQPPNRLVIRPLEEGAEVPGEFESLPVQLGHGESPYTIEFVLESRKDGSHLKMVHSCFFRGDNWDDEYDSFFHGWEHQFNSLRHLLEYHRGEERQFIHEEIKTDVAASECWDRIVGGGKVFELNESAKVGDAIQIKLASGKELGATILRYTPNRQLILDVPSLNHSLIAFGVWRRPGSRWLVFDANLFGTTEAETAAIRNDLRGVISEQFPELEAV